MSDTVTRTPNAERRTSNAEVINKAPVAHKQAIALYRTMLTIRFTEEQLLRANQRGLVHGACHT
ncbi:MAG: hypothetical protein PHU80_03000, partial [Kiritimatiellae bacterium]|nr:hypothetical protein [Kiritimatiellia bacterium]